MDVGRRRVTVVRQHPTHAAELHHLRHLGGLQRAVPTDQRTRSGDPVEGGSCNDYDYVRDDSATSFDLDGEECFSCIGREVVGAARSVARAARRVAESSAFKPLLVLPCVRRLGPHASRCPQQFLIGTGLDVVGAALRTRVGSPGASGIIRASRYGRPVHGTVAAVSYVVPSGPICCAVVSSAQVGMLHVGNGGQRARPNYPD